MGEAPVIGILTGAVLIGVDRVEETLIGEVLEDLNSVEAVQVEESLIRVVLAGEILTEEIRADRNSIEDDQIEDHQDMVIGEILK